jgi:hypothetical protein
VKKIDLFIIGAPKCGTTWLESYFLKMKNVYTLPTENHFLSSHYAANENRVMAEKFLSSVPDNGFVVSKAVWYLYDKLAIEKVKQHNPKAKIIILGREPYSLVHSKFIQFKFSNFDPSCDLEEAWNNSERMSTMEATRGFLEPKLLNYKRTGMIGKYSKKWKDFYKKDIMILHLDDIKKNPIKVIQKVSYFIGTQVDYYDIPGVVNPQKKSRSAMLSYLIFSNNRVILNLRRSKFLRLLFTNSLRKKLYHWNIKRTKLSYNSPIKNDIIKYFSDDYKLFLSLKDKI